MRPEEADDAMFDTLHVSKGGAVLRMFSDNTAVPNLFALASFAISKTQLCRRNNGPLGCARSAEAVIPMRSISWVWIFQGDLSISVSHPDK